MLSTAKKSLQTTSLALLGMVTAGTILSLLGIVQLAVISGISALPLWLQSSSFTPAGSPLILITTICFSLIATVSLSTKEKDLTKKTSLFTAAGIQLAALVAYFFMIFQGEILIQLLPLKAGWSLTLDAFKNAKELIFGVGLANFPVLFTQFKPGFLTQTDLWTTVFQTSSNEVLNILTTTGVLGFSAFAVLIGSVVKNSLKLDKSPLNLSLKLTVYAIILSFFLVPANIITYTFFFTLAGLIASQVSAENRKEIALSKPKLITTTGVLLVVTITSLYLGYKAYAAEFYMYKAQKAFAQNKADDIYTSHIKAIQLMPSITDYRISLSQINMTFASSISQLQAPNPETGEVVQLTEQQREQVSVLVQRAIEQGRIATELRPSYHASWQNLGSIYRNLINVAQGAEDFAIQSLGQAINKDPVNPLLRIEYGGLFYQLSQLVEDEETKVNMLDNAIQQFQTAVRLRPDHANAYYNLAHAFEQKGSYRLAYQAMTQALANIEDNQSPDYQRAENELFSLETMLPQDPTQQPAQLPPTQEEEPAQLQQPAPLPSPLPGGPVDLPEAELINTNLDADTLVEEPTTEPENIQLDSADDTSPSSESTE